jgi:hypothetical protein
LWVIAERTDKCQLSAVIWQCFLSSILVTYAQAAQTFGGAQRLGRPMLSASPNSPSDRAASQLLGRGLARQLPRLRWSREWDQLVRKRMQFFWAVFLFIAALPLTLFWLYASVIAPLVVSLRLLARG